MTDETAQEILSGSHTGLTGNMREDDLICMARLWLLKDEIEHAVRLVATVSIPHRELVDKIEALEAE